jgi:hypothetical protein
LALLLPASFFFVLLVARFFKTLESQHARAVRTPVIGGAAAGVVLRFLDAQPVATGILLTVVALYARLTGEESEPTDGMLLGALSGATAALPLVIDGEGRPLVVAECVLAGAVAGFGITLAVFHVADKARQIAVDAATAAAAVGAAFLAPLLLRSGLTERQIAIGAAAAVPLIVVATVFHQYPDIRAELRHEASLGFIDDGDVRATAHPFLRLGRGAWIDKHAHREFVRIANRLALRKRQQRNRSEETARLYQLEILKLRMQLQEMTRIDQAARRGELA